MYIMDEENKFFETYYSKPRFAVETCLATISVVSNALMLLLTRGNSNRRHYAYFAFFRNLLIANVLSASAQWFTNNILFMLHEQMAEVIKHDYCRFMLILIVANIVSRVFGSVSVISLLGLSVIHCLAVCYPMAYVVRMNTFKVHFAIGLSWVLTTTIAAMEIMVCVGHLTYGNCTVQSQFFAMVHLVDTDVTVIALTLLYAIIVGLCLRIALEIRRLQRRLNRLCWTDNLKQEKGTFRSIVGLTVTMIVFIFPYHVIYFLSINFDLPMIKNMSGLLLNYMNLLPYIKFATDPIFFCRKRIVQWRNVGCIFSTLVCRKASLEFSREDRALIDEQNISGITVAPAADDSIGIISGSAAPNSRKMTKDLIIKLPANTSLV